MSAATDLRTIFPTHPSTAQQAKDFTAANSLAFPGGKTVNGDQSTPAAEATINSKTDLTAEFGAKAAVNGTPAVSQIATIESNTAGSNGSAAPAGASGIVPTLQ